MGPGTQIAESAEAYEAGEVLEGQLRECYGRACYSHKVHEKCADIYFGRLRRLKLWQIGLSAVSTGGLIVTLFGDTPISTLIAAIASTILLAVNTYTKEHDLGELAQKHTNAAGELWGIRESYLSLLTDLATGVLALEDARARRDQLQEALQAVYQAAPRTMPEAYSAAQAALKVKEELTFSDAEIDALLPAKLRRGR
jgi:hypothetical protein